MQFFPLDPFLTPGTFYLALLPYPIPVTRMVRSCPLHFRGSLGSLLRPFRSTFGLSSPCFALDSAFTFWALQILSPQARFQGFRPDPFPSVPFPSHVNRLSYLPACFLSAHSPSGLSTPVNLSFTHGLWHSRWISPPALPSTLTLPFGIVSGFRLPCISARASPWSLRIPFGLAFLRFPLLAEVGTFGISASSIFKLLELSISSEPVTGSSDLDSFLELAFPIPFPPMTFFASSFRISSFRITPFVPQSFSAGTRDLLSQFLEPYLVFRPLLLFMQLDSVSSLSLLGLLLRSITPPSAFTSGSPGS